jgi:hypothetical protein
MSIHNIHHTNVTWSLSVLYKVKRRVRRYCTCDIQKNISERNDQCVTSTDLGGYQNDLLPLSGTHADSDDKSVFVTSFILPNVQPCVFWKSRNMMQTTCANIIELYFNSYAQLINVLQLHYFDTVITDYVKRWNLCLMTVISRKLFAGFASNVFLP